MKQKGLIEQKARELGVTTLKVDWLKLGGPALVNDLCCRAPPISSSPARRRS